MNRFHPWDQGKQNNGEEQDQEQDQEQDLRKQQRGQGQGEKSGTIVPSKRSQLAKLANNKFKFMCLRIIQSHDEI